MPSPRHVEQYREPGCLVVENVLDREPVAALRRATAAVVERSRAV